MVGMNGFNVGVDAHIDPQPYATTLYVEWHAPRHDRRGGYQPPAAPRNHPVTLNGTG